MAYLGNIIRHIEEHFHTHIFGHYHPRMEIEAVWFFSQHTYEKTEIQENILYIESAENILDSSAILSPKVSTEQSLPLLLLGLAGNDTNAPFLYTKESFDIFEVFNTAQEEILRLFNLKRKREELFLSLHNGNGISGLTQVAHTYLQNPVTVCDTSFSVITASPVVRDKHNLESSSGKLYLKDAQFQDMVERHVIEHIYASSLPYITTLKDYSYKWVFESIRIHHVVVGYICVRGSVRDFTEDDLEFINVFSQMLSVEMQKDAAYSQPTGLQYEYFLTELLDGLLGRTEYITQQLLRLGYPQASYYTILLLQFLHHSSTQLPYKTYFDRLRTLFPKCMVVLYHDDLVLLLPSETAEPFTGQDKERLSTFLTLNKMQAYISYPYTNIAQSRDYYLQVKDLTRLNKKKTLSSETPFIYYEKYFFEQILQQCKDQNKLKASIHPDITSIIAYDQKYDTRYVNTLQTYLAHNRNAAAAAEALHIHKSTFFYRIGKMNELFGLDINDCNKMFAYEYSLRLLEYLSSK